MRLRLLKIILLTGICVSCLNVSRAIADQDVSTYHTSPFGVFHRLRLEPRAPLPTGCTEGTLYIDEVIQQLQICDSAGNWVGLSGIWERATVAGDPVIFVMPKDVTKTLRVGINTVLVPRETLEVRGTWSDIFNIQGGSVWGEVVKLGTSATSYGRMETIWDAGFYYSQFSAVNDTTSNFLTYKIDGSEIVLSMENIIAGAWPTIPTNTRNVGIGLSAPTNLLHVRDIAQAKEIRGEKEPVIINPTTVYYPTIYSYMKGSSGVLPVEFGAKDDDAGTDFPLMIMARWAVLMQSNSTGNVGIGTSAPSQKLDVNGTFQAKHYVAQSSAIGPYLEIKQNSFPSQLALVGYKLSLPAGYVPIRIDGSPVVLQLNSGGAVGIGTSTPGAGFKLDVNGNTFAISFVETSDERLKKDIVQIDSALEKLEGIKAFRYHLKDPGTKESDRDYIGVIAQDVEKSFPHLVVTDEKGMKAVSYSGLIAPLVEAVKELKIEHDQLKARLAELERDVVSEVVPASN